MNPQERNSKPEEQQSVEERLAKSAGNQNLTVKPEGVQNRTPMEEHRGGPLPNQKR